MSSHLPPGSCLEFLSRIGFSNPIARRFFVGCCYFPRSRAFRKVICAQEKSPRIYTSMHSGGFELTKLTYIPGSRIMIRHRGDRISYVPPTSTQTKFWYDTSQNTLLVVVVVVLILTRIIKSVVTGQAPVTLGLRNTPRKKHKPKYNAMTALNTLLA